jgi:hypothetical protein
MKSAQKRIRLRAMEELKMLTQTDIERERYEARRKAQLDHNSDIKAARMEGEAEGETKGLIKGLAEGLATGKISEIHLCERLLQRSETPADQLQRLSLEELTRLADDLQVQLLSQR